MRTCLLAFHVTDEYRQDDVIGDEFDQQLPAAGFPGSVSDDVIMAGSKDAPGPLLSMNEEDEEEDDVDNDAYNMAKDESRSTVDYRKAESVV